MEVGCCGLALQTEGQKGRAGEGSSLGNWEGSPQPEELADDKALGAKCSPGCWGDGEEMGEEMGEECN